MQTENSLLDEVRDDLAGKPATAAKRTRTKWNAILLIVLVTVLNSFGNLLLAKGMKTLPSVGVNPLDYILAMWNPFVAPGIVLLILWLLSRMTLLSWADLSFAVPLMAVGYVIAPVLGHFILKEPVSAEHWAGALLIFIGCGLVGTTEHRHDGDKT